MKQVLIHWHRGDCYERKHLRKAVIRKAHRTIRQKTRLQLKEYNGDLDTDEYSVYPTSWYDECEYDPNYVLYYDDFIQPTVHLGYFD
jgi:hypothetical protein